MSVQNGTYTRTNSFGKGDETCFPRFYLEAQINPVASQTAGREIYSDIEMVEIILPGNPLTRPVERVNDSHRERWPEHYSRFKAQAEQRPEGKPIEEWPELRPAQVRELKSLEMHVVEQVAAMSEVAIQRIGMGARLLKQKAQAYLDDMEGHAPTKRLLEENELLRNQLAAQANQISELSAILERLQARIVATQDAPTGIGTTIPGMLDPLQAAGFASGGAAPAAPAQSALASAEEAKPRRGIKRAQAA